MDTASRESRPQGGGAGAGPGDSARLRAANLRTALVLLAIAMTFFVGVIASKYMGGYEVGMSVVGFAVFVFLVFAIGRNLRKGA